jgi:hypothetical protein
VSTPLSKLHGRAYTREIQREARAADNDLARKYGIISRDYMNRMADRAYNPRKMRFDGRAARKSTRRSTRG